MILEKHLSFINPQQSFSDEQEEGVEAELDEINLSLQDDMKMFIASKLESVRKEIVQRRKELDEKMKKCFHEKEEVISAAHNKYLDEKEQIEDKYIKEIDLLKGNIQVYCYVLIKADKHTIYLIKLQNCISYVALSLRLQAYIHIIEQINRNVWARSWHPEGLSCKPAACSVWGGGGGCGGQNQVRVGVPGLHGGNATAAQVTIMRRILSNISSQSDICCFDRTYPDTQVKLPACFAVLLCCRIWQCSDGHAVCEVCRKRPDMSSCPTCRKYLVGRSTIAEKLARALYPPQPD